MPEMRALGLLLSFCVLSPAADIRLGIVGTDTSHAVAFTQILNDPNARGHVPGARVVAAYKGGSPDVESSYTRVDKFAETLKTRWNVEFVPDIPTLCRKVDAVLLESVDGRVHLEQARQVIASGKPVFIDKPLAATYEDALEIYRLAKAANVPWFTSSSLRYSEIATKMKFDDAKGVITWGPGPTEPHHYLDLSWYGIHAVEMLFALMGTGCQEVVRSSAPSVDVITCTWKDGRVGTVYSLRTGGDYGATVFRPKQIVQSSPDMREGYEPLVQEIVKFFQTKTPPVPYEETLEIFAFMDAAQRSKAAGGAPMKLR